MLPQKCKEACIIYAIVLCPNCIIIIYNENPIDIEKANLELTVLITTNGEETISINMCFEFISPDNIRFWS